MNIVTRLSLVRHSAFQSSIPTSLQNPRLTRVVSSIFGTPLPINQAVKVQQGLFIKSTDIEKTKKISDCWGRIMSPTPKELPSCWEGIISSLK